MVAVFGNQHLRQQPGGRDILVDDVRRDRCLDQGPAVPTGPLAADMPLDCEHAWRIVQLLADVFAHALPLATALARGVFRLVMDVRTRQFRWQGHTLRLLPRLSGTRGRLKLFELGFQCRQVCIDRLVEQAHLFGIKLLAAFAELQALEHGEFVRQLIDTRLTVVQFTLRLADLGHQLSGQCAQLLRAKGIEVGGQIHTAQSARAGTARTCQEFRVLRSVKNLS